MSDIKPMCENCGGEMELLSSGRGLVHTGFQCMRHLAARISAVEARRDPSAKCSEPAEATWAKAHEDSKTVACTQAKGVACDHDVCRTLRKHGSPPVEPAPEKPVHDGRCPRNCDDCGRYVERKLREEAAAPEKPGRVCESWCGTAPGPDPVPNAVYYGSSPAVAYCSRACRDAGRPLSPATISKTETVAPPVTVGAEPAQSQHPFLPGHHLSNVCVCGAHRAGLVHSPPAAPQGAGDGDTVDGTCGPVSHVEAIRIGVAAYNGKMTVGEGWKLGRYLNDADATIRKLRAELAAAERYTKELRDLIEIHEESETKLMKELAALRAAAGTSETVRAGIVRYLRAAARKYETGDDATERDDVFADAYAGAADSIERRLDEEAAGRAENESYVIENKRLQYELRAARAAAVPNEAVRRWRELDHEERRRLLRSISAGTWAKMETCRLAERVLTEAAGPAETKEG